MRNTGFMGAVAVALAGIVLWGGFIAPKPAMADNDLERVLAGLAAGAVVYGMMGDDDGPRRSYHGGSRYTGRSRGFYNGNRGAWERKQERSQRYRQPPGRRPSSTYRRGWHHGYDRGFDRGHDIGYDRGFDDGYDWGYDDGYDDGWGDGYSRGRRTGWGCWGY